LNKIEHFSKISEKHIQKDKKRTLFAWFTIAIMEQWSAGIMGLKEFFTI